MVGVISGRVVERAQENTLKIHFIDTKNIKGHITHAYILCYRHGIYDVQTIFMEVNKWDGVAYEKDLYLKRECYLI